MVKQLLQIKKKRHEKKIKNKVFALCRDIKYIQLLYIFAFQEKASKT